MVTLGSINPTVEGVTAGRNGKVFITGTFFDDVGVNAVSDDAGFERLANEGRDGFVDFDETTYDAVGSIRDKLLELAVDDPNRVSIVEVAIEDLPEEQVQPD